MSSHPPTDSDFQRVVGELRVDDYGNLVGDESGHPLRQLLNDRDITGWNGTSADLEGLPPEVRDLIYHSWRWQGGSLYSHLTPTTTLRLYAEDSSTRRLVTRLVKSRRRQLYVQALASVVDGKLLPLLPRLPTYRYTDTHTHNLRLLYDDVLHGSRVGDLLRKALYLDATTAIREMAPDLRGQLRRLTTRPLQQLWLATRLAQLLLREVPDVDLTLLLEILGEQDMTGEMDLHRWLEGRLLEQYDYNLTTDLDIHGYWNEASNLDDLRGRVLLWDGNLKVRALSGTSGVPTGTFVLPGWNAPLLVMATHLAGPLWGRDYYEVSQVVRNISGSGHNLPGPLPDQQVTTSVDATLLELLGLVLYHLTRREITNSRSQSVDIDEVYSSQYRQRLLEWLRDDLTRNYEEGILTRDPESWAHYWERLANSQRYAASIATLVDEIEARLLGSALLLVGSHYANLEPHLQPVADHIHLVQGRSQRWQDLAEVGGVLVEIIVEGWSNQAEVQNYATIEGAIASGRLLDMLDDSEARAAMYALTLRLERGK